MKKFLLIFLSIAQSQSIDVTFRYVEKPNDNFIRVFIPGTMPSGSTNDWGPNSNGVINTSAPSLMSLNEEIDAYEKSYNLEIGTEYLYKIHYHYNNSGTDYNWVSDPLNSETTNDGWDNSILNVTDPLFFQPARHLNEEGLVDGLSIGIFTTGNVDSIRYAVGGDTISDNALYNENGVFYASLNPPKTLFESYLIQVSIDGEMHTAFYQPEIEIIDADIPTNVKMGPNWIDNNMILAVYAPSQPVMQVIVTAPGETGLASDAIVMSRDISETDIWWIELDLSVGQYEYEYLLLNGNRIPDPYSRSLANGKTRIEIGPGGVTTADDFVWSSEDYVRPSLDTLIIYELHVDDFAAQGSGNGKFDHVIDKLDHLKSTGINAIELMPVTEFPGDRSWGYDPEIMSAVESAYGNPEDFKRLVDEAHVRGIAVILDLVWNHIRSTSPIWQIQPDYDLNPYIKVHTELNPNETEGTWGMLDLDHFNHQTIDYINKVHEIWVNEYRIDGFRFDATRYVGWDLNQPDLGLPAWTHALTQMSSDLYLIAEHLPADPWLIENTSLTSSWHDSFHDLIKDDAHGQYNTTFTYLSQVVGLHEYSNWDDPYSHRTAAMKYMISHDEQSVIQEMVVFDNYSVGEARDRDKFLSTIMFTSLGIPMLFQGQEFGFQSGWNDENGNGNWDEEKLGYRAVDWSLLDTEIGQSHLAHYSSLAKLRKQNPAFSKGTFYDLWRYTSERVLVYGYKDESDGNTNDQVVVIANFSSSNQTVDDVPFLSAGTWYNYLHPGNDLYTSDGNYGEYLIPAKTAIIYTNQHYELDTDDQITIPEQVNLISTYPNPFNGQVKINLFLNQSVKGTLSIFDLSGKKIKSFNQSYWAAGHQYIQWNGMGNSGKSISSGIYFVRFDSDRSQLNKKILYLK